VSELAPEVAATPRYETIFARILERQPTEVEKLQLYRLKDALGLGENDALFSVLIALQHFEWLYEQHPERIEEAGRKTVADVGKAAEAAVAVEVGRVRKHLAEAVSSAARAVADAQAETARRMAKWWAAAGMTIFGGLCMVCGYELGRGRLPFWMRRELAESAGPAAMKVAGAILGAPAGWMALVLLVPVLVPTATAAWERFQDPSGNRLVRRKALVVFSAAIAGCVACAILLALLARWTWA
jgi:hypothetical protein